MSVIVKFQQLQKSNRILCLKEGKEEREIENERKKAENENYKEMRNLTQRFISKYL